MAGSKAVPAKKSKKPDGRRRTASYRLPRNSTAGENGPSLLRGDVMDVVNQLERGLPVEVLEQLKRDLNLSWSEVGHLVQITPRTLSRRRKAGRLSTDESERALRLARVYERAVGFFGGDAAMAEDWLRHPCRALGNKTPLSFSRTEPGAREVENVIGRLEHGVFS